MYTVVDTILLLQTTIWLMEYSQRYIFQSYFEKAGGTYATIFVGVI